MESNGRETDSESAPTRPEAGGHDPGSSRERPVQGHSPLERPDPGQYTEADEPIPVGQPVDWRYLYELVQERVEREQDRGRGFDSKIAALLAGVVASIGFSFRVNPSPLTTWATALYVVPLFFLVLAFSTRLGKEAPTAESLHKYFPAWPVTTVKQAVAAMVSAVEFDRKLNDRKAARVDLSLYSLGLVTAIVIIMQIATLYSTPGSPSSSFRSQPIATSAPDAGRVGHRYAKSSVVVERKRIAWSDSAR